MGSAPAIDLSQFDDEYRKQSGNVRPKPQPLPDGKYAVLVEKVEVSQTVTTGTPALKWTFRVTSTGPFSNRMVWKTTVISDKTMPMIREDLETCGLILERFADLPARLGELLDLPLAITKRTKDGYENVYLNRRLDLEEERDDLPF